MRRFTPSMLLPSLGLAAALMFAACSSNDDNGGTGGSGGHTGAAGTTGSAGSPGEGGSSGPAGAPGHGGSNGPAGAPGHGGSSGPAGAGGSVGGSGPGGSGGTLANGGNGEAGSGGGAGGASGGHGGGATGKGGGSSGGSTGAGGDSGGGTFTLSSPDQAEGAKFDGMFTCNGGSLGGGINPELDWKGVPAGTKSFAITFIDTTIGADKPTGQHWAIWNIPWDASTGKVAVFPKGTKTLSGDLMNAKQSGTFLAPCAQSVTNNMDDQYEFKIFALSDATLNVTPGTSVANALTALGKVTPLGTATLHGHAGLKGK